MKLYLNLLLPKAIRIKFLLFTFFLLLSCHEDQLSNTDNYPNSILQSKILGESLAKFNISSGSMDEISYYIKLKYDINLEEEYKKISQYFFSANSEDIKVRIKEININDISIILENAGIYKESYSYNYLVQLSNLFENDEIEEGELQNSLNNLKINIENDFTIPAEEKERLILTSTLLANNFQEILDNLYSLEGGSQGVRTKGWFKKVWRIVRSVVVTAGVGVLIGASAGAVGAIVGGIVMGAVAITDAAANDYCHYAMQCDGGWRQSCTTGECTPYLQ